MFASMNLSVMAKPLPASRPRTRAGAPRRGGVVHVVASRRSRSKKASKTRELMELLPGGDADAVGGTETVRAPAPAQGPQTEIERKRAAAAAAVKAASPGPERLSDREWAEIDASNQQARDAQGAAAQPGPAGTGFLDKALGSDAMLLFGVDGCVPETVNGRVAMFGFSSAIVTEMATGRSFTTQLAFNLTHGISLAIATTMIVATLAPAFMAKPEVGPASVLASSSSSSSGSFFFLACDGPGAEPRSGPGLADSARACQVNDTRFEPSIVDT